MVLGDSWDMDSTKKLDVPRAAAVCLVGERYDRQYPSEIALAASGSEVVERIK